MEFLKESNVPEYYKNIIGDSCRFCDSDFIVNETRTVVKCSNPKCPRKIAGSIKAILTQDGVKGYGVTTCLNMIRNNSYTSTMDFFETPPAELAQEVKNIKDKIFRLDDAVRALYIPGFDENASKLFSNYGCMEDFLEQVDEYGTSELEISAAFGQGALGQNIFEIVEDNMEEFYRLDNVFGIDRESTNKLQYDIDICVTGGVYSTYLISKGVTVSTRAQLVSYLNKSFSHLGYRFNLKSSVTESVSFVVCDGDGDSNSTKAKAGRNKGILVTTDGLLAALARHMKENGAI